MSIRIFDLETRSNIPSWEVDDIKDSMREEAERENDYDEEEEYSDSGSESGDEYYEDYSDSDDEPQDIAAITRASDESVPFDAERVNQRVYDTFSKFCPFVFIREHFEETYDIIYVESIPRSESDQVYEFTVEIPIVPKAPCII